MALHDGAEGAARASGMEVLRARIRAAKVPRARAGNLRMATWNIRRFGEGRRLRESIEMIAAMIGVFDVVAIVELCEDVGDLRRVLAALGPGWRAVFSDYLRDAAGNRERMGFVFDSARVTFTGLASTAEGERRLVGGRLVEEVPWWRLPFMASFAAVGSAGAAGASRPSGEGSAFEFMLIAAHVRWGSRVEARYAELGALAAWVKRRMKEPHFGDKDILVVGDFNVRTLPDPRRRGALGFEGFTLPALPGLPKRYDEIMSLGAARFTGRAGAIDFASEGRHGLFPGRRMSEEAFTFQLSDHLPLWAEVATGARRPGTGREPR